MPRPADKPEKIVEAAFPVGTRLRHRQHKDTIVEMGVKAGREFWMMQIAPTWSKGKVDAHVILRDYERVIE